MARKHQLATGRACAEAIAFQPSGVSVRAARLARTRRASHVRGLHEAKMGAHTSVGQGGVHVGALVQGRPDGQRAGPSRDVALLKLIRQVLRDLDWRALPKVRGVRHAQGGPVIPRLSTGKVRENGARRGRGGLLVALLLAAGVGHRRFGRVRLGSWAEKGEHEEEDKPSAPRVTTRQPRGAPVARPRGTTQGHGEDRAQNCTAESHPGPCTQCARRRARRHRRWRWGQRRRRRRRRRRRQRGQRR